MSFSEDFTRSQSYIQNVIKKVRCKLLGFPLFEIAFNSLKCLHKFNAYSSNLKSILLKLIRYGI